MIVFESMIELSGGLVIDVMSFIAKVAGGSVCSITLTCSVMILAPAVGSWLRTTVSVMTVSVGML